jgi:hypothetical protein
MLRLAVPLILFVLIASPALATPGAQHGAAAAKACALLSKDLIAQHTPYEKDAQKLVFSIPPEEEKVGATGSACEYGGVHLQVNPFASPQYVEQQLVKDGWTRESGLGDVAMYRDNRGSYAELYVRSGARVITIQMSVPNVKTAAGIKPNAVALAKAVLAKIG